MARRRSLLAVATAILLATVLPRAAYASAPWSPDCNGTSNTVCIYRDSGWNGSEADMSGNNWDYSGETWPSSNYPVNDSVSSTKNFYGSSRVRWWTAAGYSQHMLCNNPGQGFTWFGLLYNDAFSSHEIVAGNC